MDREIDMFSIPEDEGEEVQGSETPAQSEELSEDANEVDRVAERMEIKKLLLAQRAKERPQRERINIFGKLGQVSEFWREQPFFYDKTKQFWLWDNEEYRWEVSDVVDLCNSIRDEISTDTISSKEYGELIRAFQQFGRTKIPKKPKPTWMQFKNQIFDIITGEEFKATPEYFVANPIPWKIGESKDTPTIDKLLEEWVGKDYVLTLKEILATSMMGYLPLHRIFCLIGKGRNGKDTFVKLNMKLIGEYNCVASDIDKLIKSRFEVIKLYKKLLCIVGEIDKTIFSQTRILKAISGETLLSGEWKGKDPIDFVNYASPIIMTNCLPETTDKTDGFYSRWCIIDFPNRFEEQACPIKSIPDVEFENFCAQVPEIIRNLIQRKRYHKEGTIEERKQKYETHSNTIDLFIDEYCDKDVDGIIEYSDFYIKFSDYLKTNSLRVQSMIEISKTLNLRNIEKKVKSWADVFGKHNAMAILGLKWK